MIKLNFACIATGASVDNATGNVTLFNIVEEVRIPKDRLPVAIPEIAFVGSFTRLEPNIKTMGFKLDYLMPNGKTIAVGKSETQFQGDRLRLVMRLNGMPLESAGRHKLRLTWNWTPTTATKGDEDDHEGSFDIFLDCMVVEPSQMANA